MRSPLNKPYRVTSPFGQRILGGVANNHTGIDLVPADGKHPTEVCSTVKGYVSDCRTNVPDSHTGLGVTTMMTGNYVNIKTSEGYTVVYRHLKANSVKVQKGMNIYIGDVIGIMGTTGQSTGVHLHYEIQSDKGTPIDPAPYLGTTKEFAASVSPATPQTPTGALKVSDKVKVKQGAKTYTGGALAGFVYSTLYDVLEVKGDRIVIGLGKAVTAAVNANDLYRN